MPVTSLYGCDVTACIAPLHDYIASMNITLGHDDDAFQSLNTVKSIDNGMCRLFTSVTRNARRPERFDVALWVAKGTFTLAPDFMVVQVSKRSFLKSSDRLEFRELPAGVTPHQLQVVEWIMLGEAGTSGLGAIDLIKPALAAAAQDEAVGLSPAVSR